MDTEEDGVVHLLREIERRMAYADEVEPRLARLFYCAGERCQGLPYPASLAAPHPYSCVRDDGTPAVRRRGGSVPEDLEKDEEDELPP